MNIGKVKTNDKSSNIQTPLINGSTPSQIEEQASVEIQVNSNELFWFNLLCSIGLVFTPICVKGRFYSTNVAWSVFPLCVLGYFIYGLIENTFKLIHSFSRGNISFQLLFIFILILPVTLTYTRKSFSEAIAREQSATYVNILAKRSIILSVVISIIVMIVNASETRTFAKAAINFLVCISVGSVIGVVIIRCLMVTEINALQQNTLMQMAQGQDAQSFQKKLLENSAKLETASAYLEIPLGVCFSLGTMNLGFTCILLYARSGELYNFVLAMAFAFIVLFPLRLLTLIDKQYMVTLRAALSCNTVMLHTDRTYILLAYNNIAPRVKFFGIYITQGLIASLAVTFFGALVPKIVGYIMSLPIW